MSYPTVFANLAAGNQPASLIDTMFNVAGQQGNIPCTASGTNAITLTPSTNYYLPVAYTIAQIASFKATVTSTGSVTAQIGGLGFIKLFTAAGIQAASGDIVINTHYSLQYWADLDSGNGGFIILNATVTAVANSVQATFKNLKLITTSNNSLTPTADAILLQNAGGGTVRLTSVAPAVTSTASVGTANGIISAVANSTWYSFWFIYNPNAALSSTNPAGWLDTSATSPTLPSGYTYFARYGWFRTDSSANLLGILQYGREVQYVRGLAATTTLPQIVTGTQAGFANVSITGFVPSTASRIQFVMFVSGTGSAIAVAPNTGYGVITSTTNPPPFGLTSGTGAGAFSGPGDMMLESTNIAWLTTGSTGTIYAFGWTDNL